MKTQLVVALLSTCSLAFGAIVEFSSQSKIKASDLNNNFSYVEELLSARNGQVSFSLFTSGELITKEGLEQEFAKVRLLGVEVDELSSPKIKASDLNKAFSQMTSGATDFNDVPVAENITLSFNEDTNHTSGSFNFTNVVGTSQVIITGQPSKGVVTLNGNTYSYTPEANYSGSDSFKYKIFDGTHYSNEATVSFSITAVNDVPLALAQSVSTIEDTPLSITLNATDVESQASLTYSVVTQPTNGQISGSGKTITYSPGPNYSGNDSFTFKANDGVADSLPATISVAVTAVNDAPVLTNTAPNFSMDLNTIYTSQLVVTDPDSSNFTYQVASQASNGIISVSATGLLTYTPNSNYYGTDAFSLRVNDGLLNSSPLNFSATITGKGIIIGAGDIRTYYNGTNASSCNAYKTTNNGALTYTGKGAASGKYRINALPSGTAVVYCNMDLNGGGWTMFARFNGSHTTSYHYGSLDFGTLDSTTDHYSITSTKLGSVSKIMAKSPAGNRVWTLTSPQTLAIPQSGNFYAQIAENGDDNCHSNGLHYYDSGCWAGRKAGPAVSNSVAGTSACGGLGNWYPTTRFYGRAHEGNNTSSPNCTPRGKWNQSQQEGVYAPMQEWYIK